jgi:hypothetical protein
VKKLLALAGASAAAVAIAVISAGPALGDAPIDTSGETFAKAVQLLKQQGWKATFGGAVGSDVPQPQCIVESQKILNGWPQGRVSLMLNCTKAAQPAPSQQPALPPGVAPGAPNPNGGPPHVGANGITTVTATPVAPGPPVAPQG